MNMYLCFDIPINIYTCICTYSDIHNMTVPIELSSRKLRTCYGGLPASTAPQVLCWDRKCNMWRWVTVYICKGSRRGVWHIHHVHVHMHTHFYVYRYMSHACMFFFPPSLSLSLSPFLFMLCIHRFSRTMTWVGPKMWIQSQNMPNFRRKRIHDKLLGALSNKATVCGCSSWEIMKLDLALFGWTFSLKKDPTNETDCSGICVVEPWRQGYMQFFWNLWNKGSVQSVSLSLSLSMYIYIYIYIHTHVSIYTVLYNCQNGDWRWTWTALESHVTSPLPQLVSLRNCTQSWSHGTPAMADAPTSQPSSKTSGG